jgi:hypothetical protein
MNKLILGFFALFNISLASAVTVFLTVNNGTALTSQAQAVVILKNTGTNNSLLPNITYTVQCSIINNNTAFAPMAFSVIGITKGIAFLQTNTATIQIPSTTFSVPTNPIFNSQDFFIMNTVRLTPGTTYATLTFVNQCPAVTCTIPLIVENCFARST